MPAVALAAHAAPPASEAISARARPGVPRYTIEQLFATRTIGDAAWSPDGERVVAVTNISGRNNLWLIPAAGGWPTQLTMSEQRQAAPAWSPDARWIAFQSDHDADEQWDLFLVSPANGEVKNLTNTPAIAEEGPLWSPDSRWIAYAVKPRSAPNYEIGLWDVRAGRGRALTRGTPPDWSLAPVGFAPDGKWLIASRIHASDKDASAVLVDLGTGAVHDLTPHSGEQRWIPADLSPDGRRVLVESDARNGFANAALLDLGTRPGHGVVPPVTWLTEERAEVSAGNFSPDGRAVTVRVNLEGNGELYTLSLADRSRTRLAVAPGFNGFAGSPSSYSADGTRLLLRRNAFDSPGDLLVYDLGTAAAWPITHALVAGVDAADLVEPVLVHYPSRDGLSISAFLYLPWKLEKNASHPAIVWVHGGPTSQSVNGFSRPIEYFANRGFVVLAPNDRGSTGYGRAFMDANRFDMGGGDLADVIAGARFLERTGLVDAKKTAVAGGSYGGYLTMAAVTQSPEVWAAGAALFAFVNWFTELEHEDPLLRQYDLATMGDPKTSEALFRDRSPIFFLDRVRAPLLLAAGGNDPRCPPDESRQVVEALKQRGRTCEFLFYADEGHGFARLENLFDAYRKIAAFLERVLGGGHPARAGGRPPAP